MHLERTIQSLPKLNHGFNKKANQNFKKGFHHSQPGDSQIHTEEEKPENHQNTTEEEQLGRW